MSDLKSVINYMGKTTVIILFAILLFPYCKLESFGDSVEPVIDLESLTIATNKANIDTIIVLKLNYTDGDGDIGLGEQDTFSPFRFGEKYFNNFWIKLEYKDSAGNWNPTSDDTLELSQRIINITPKGEVKSIRGKMELFIPVKPTLFFNHKIVRYSFTLVDRKQNESNTITSQELKLNF